MRIEAIGVAIPSLAISNQAVLDGIERMNPEVPRASILRYQRAVASALARAGSETRHVRDRERGESSLALVRTAVSNALEQGSFASTDIDLLIYCGVAKGYLEPATAYSIAHAAGLKCDCFDVGDACLGWLRSVYLASQLIHTQAYRRVMIVNAECGFYEHGYPELLKIGTFERLKWTLPAFTIGEAATATILSPGGGAWNFRFASAPEHVGLCGIPIAGYAEFSENGNARAPNGIGILYAYGNEMIAAGKAGLVQLIRASISEPARVETWFPHVVAVDAALAVADEVGVERERVFVGAFRKFGNVVSASVPLGMSMALRAGKLERGARVGVCVGSAGMAFGVGEFEY